MRMIPAVYVTDDDQTWDVMTRSWIGGRAENVTDEVATIDAARVFLRGNYHPHPPGADDVRAEAQRRIIALTGATSLIETIVKQSNANMRANELNDKRINGDVLTAQEQAETDGLRALADAIKAIRAASNVMEPNPPANFTDDSNWP